MDSVFLSDVPEVMRMAANAAIARTQTAITDIMISCFFFWDSFFSSSRSAHRILLIFKNFTGAIVVEDVLFSFNDSLRVFIKFSLKKSFSLAITSSKFHKGKPSTPYYNTNSHIKIRKI